MPEKRTNDDEMLTVNKVAEMLDCPPLAVERMINGGILLAHRTRDGFLVRAADLAPILNARKAGMNIRPAKIRQ